MSEEAFFSRLFTQSVWPSLIRNFFVIAPNLAIIDFATELEFRACNYFTIFCFWYRNNSNCNLTKIIDELQIKFDKTKEYLDILYKR